MKRELVHQVRCLKILTAILTVVACGLGVAYGYLQTQTEADFASETQFEEVDHFALGEYYFNVNGQGEYDLERARHHYNRIVQLDPAAHPEVWYSLGHIDFIEGKFDDALMKFDRQLEYFGDTVPNVYYMIGLTYAFRARDTGNPEDWQKGAEGFENFILFEPFSPWARTDLSWIYFAQGKFDAMSEILQPAIAAYPDNPWVLNMYGLYKLNTVGADAARPYIIKASEISQGLTPDDWGAAYPSNHPIIWERGLREFQSILDRNLQLVMEPAT